MSNNPNTWVYDKTKGTFTGNNGSSYPANSGVPLLNSNESTRNFGSTPSGTYTAEKCRIGTGEIKRCDLKPSSDTDVKGRTNLQVHEKSTNMFKNVLNLDSRGCIATDGAKEVKSGDTIIVKK